MLQKNGYERIILFAKLSAGSNVALAAVKLMLGLSSLSFFLCANAGYSLGLGLSKVIAVRGHHACKGPLRDMRPEYRCYSWVGVILLLSSLAYMVCCFRLFFFGNGIQFTPAVAIAIAAFTFTELTLSIRGVIMTRKNRQPLAESIKLANLASSLISLALTQTAILSFADSRDLSFFNGLSGLLFGGCAVLIGVYMILRARRRLGAAPRNDSSFMAQCS